MRTVTTIINTKYDTNLYEYDELSLEAQERAFSEWYETQCEHEFYFSSEYKNSLEKFCDIFNVEMRRVEVDDAYYNFDFDINSEFEWVHSLDDEHMRDERLSKFLYNHFYKKITKGKFYSTPGYYKDGKFHYSYRHSKIHPTRELVLTGMYTDYPIMEEIYLAIDQKKNYSSYEELILNCLESFFSSWKSDMEYSLSEDFFKEECYANGWEFDKNGNLWD